jgi:hypothetical protein
MDSAYGFERQDDFEEPMIEAPPPMIGNAERRLHVRAFDHWVSLLHGRAFPSIADLDFDAIGEFEPRSVMLDYRPGQAAPAVTRIGRTLREECNVAETIRSVADVPRGSLLSRLTDHYLEILGVRAPIGFEAEFTNHQGLPTLYRGILMPFSSDGQAIDHVLGVINWKHLAAGPLEDQLRAEIEGLNGWTKPSRH